MPPGRVVSSGLIRGALPSTPDRRHVERKSKAAVVARVKELEKERDEGIVMRPGNRWTLEEWLVHWLENIARPHLRHTSYSAYRVAVHTHLVSGIGAHKLHKLEPEHLEKFYQRMIANGSKAATAHQVHRTARVALGEALRRGHLKSNPAAIAKPPRITDEDVVPYSVEEAQRIMNEATERPNSARWTVALSLGLRQGKRSRCGGGMSTWTPRRCESSGPACAQSTITDAVESVVARTRDIARTRCRRIRSLARLRAVRGNARSVCRTN
jgi:Phage integrase, N-terminal SAM-like domain